MLSLAWRAIVVVCFCLLLAGCRVDLNKGLSEREANEMLAILLQHDIPSYKVAEKEGLVTLQVDEKDVLRAISILQRHGYPRRSYDSLGSVFQKSGIMSSPFEERVRFNYALAEELSQTLNQIDGVVSARVHIVLPDKAELGQEPKPSSAAVFIKHRPDVDLDFFVPQVKRLVSNAVEGIAYDRVSVVLIAGDAVETDAKSECPASTTVLPGLRILSEDSSTFYTMLAFGGGILLILGLGNVVLFALYVKARSGSGYQRRGGGSDELG